MIIKMDEFFLNPFECFGKKNINQVRNFKLELVLKNLLKLRMTSRNDRQK